MKLRIALKITRKRDRFLMKSTKEQILEFYKSNSRHLYLEQKAFTVICKHYRKTRNFVNKEIYGKE